MFAEVVLASVAPATPLVGDPLGNVVAETEPAGEIAKHAGRHRHDHTHGETEPHATGQGEGAKPAALYPYEG